jgi:hypothetical protein
VLAAEQSTPLVVVVVVCSTLAIENCIMCVCVCVVGRGSVIWQQQHRHVKMARCVCCYSTFCPLLMLLLLLLLLPQTEEEKKKLTGVGLLVVDTESSSSIDPDSYYVVAAPPGSSQQLQLKDGTQLMSSNGSSEVVARVLFLCRPPNRESQITSSELLQL